MVEKIMECFKNCEEVNAVLLGDSRATKVFDENSDYDLYVYLNRELDKNIRQSIFG